MGYFNKSVAVGSSNDARKTADDWFNEFVAGGEDDGVDALYHLIENQAETHLLAALHSPRGMVMESAAYGLMECWISECGYVARGDLQRGIDALAEGDFDIAEGVFINLMHVHGDWAEPIHQLATLRYIQGHNHDSIQLQRSAIRLKPHHFGAWHGLALNAVDVQDWTLACDCALRALAIRPRCSAALCILERARIQLTQAG